MFGDVTTEIRRGGELHRVGDLRERETVVFEQLFEDRDGVAVDEGGDAAARRAAHGVGEIFGRDVEPPGVVADFALGATDAGLQQLHQFLYDKAAAVGRFQRAVMLGMEVEEVVHYRAAQASHQLAIEQVRSLARTVAEPADIFREPPGVRFAEGEHRIVVQHYPAADAEVVGRQLGVQEFERRCEKLHPQVGMRCRVADLVGQNQDRRIVAAEVPAAVVEDEAALALETNQVQAPSVKPFVVDLPEVRGKYEIRFVVLVHIAKVISYFDDKRTFLRNL